MIQVLYNGFLGNHLFQYCFGRILATNLGYAFDPHALPGFPNTGTEVYGKKYNNPIQTTKNNHVVDMPGIIFDNSQRKIVLSGFYQRYEYYRDHKDDIKNDWLIVENRLPKRRSADAVVHVRRGDYVDIGYSLTLDSYRKMIDSVNFESLYIVTDAPEDAFFKGFADYNPTIVSQDRISDFKFLMSFDNIILSQSTYSWWAAFLSDASTIVFPITKNGIWGSDSRHDISLAVTDEERYQYVLCEVEEKGKKNG